MLKALSERLLETGYSQGLQVLPTGDISWHLLRHSSQRLGPAVRFPCWLGLLDLEVGPLDPGISCKVFKLVRATVLCPVGSGKQDQLRGPVGKAVGRGSSSGCPPWTDCPRSGCWQAVCSQSGSLKGNQATKNTEAVGGDTNIATSFW